MLPSQFNIVYKCMSVIRSFKMRIAFMTTFSQKKHFTRWSGDARRVSWGFLYFSSLKQRLHKDHLASLIVQFFEIQMLCLNCCERIHGKIDEAITWHTASTKWLRWQMSNSLRVTHSLNDKTPENVCAKRKCIKHIRCSCRYIETP